MLRILKEVSLNLFVRLDVNETKYQSMGAAFKLFADFENPGSYFSWRKRFSK